MTTTTTSAPTSRSATSRRPSCRAALSAACGVTGIALVLGGSTQALAASSLSASAGPPEPASSAAGAAGAATVPKGSIVYVKNNNIWIMRGDGTGKRQVTKDGTAALPYRSPSESDSGTIAAARGDLIIRLNRAGTKLNTIDPPAVKNSVGEPMDGPVTEVAISPDGKKIAYSFSWYSCPPAADCAVRGVTAYTAADHLTPPSTYKTTLYATPSWVGNSRTLQNGSTSTQIQIHDLTKTSVHWFWDSDYANPSTDITDAELSDDGKQLALVRGYGSNQTILWFTVNGNALHGPAPAPPTPNCLTNASPNVSSPTWAPAGAGLAYAYPAGIYVVTNPAVCGASAPVLIAPGGSHPDWSPATLT